MLKYAIILLDDESVSFCSYDSLESGRGISLETLGASVLWAMKENLEIQFVYPNKELDKRILGLIDSVSHVNVMSTSCPYLDYADIIVVNSFNDISSTHWKEEGSYIVRLSIKDFTKSIELIELEDIAPNRVNFVFKDRHSFVACDIEEYQTALERFSEYILKKAIEGGKLIQSNVLTDRLFLDSMNNCAAGDESITIAPNGSFYICPAFYVDSMAACGSVPSSPDILNQQLFKLEKAPICRHCDAYQCARCVWMNLQSTLEVNTPSRGQCLTAHVERKTSSKLLEELRSHKLQVEGMVPGIDPLPYLDPFDNRLNWD
jgi:CXXX repeat peptide maturase